MNFPNSLLENVDFNSPKVYLFFVGLLIFLPYWWWHEETEVNREFGRFLREVAKEQPLKELYGNNTSNWKSRLVVPALFNLNRWVVLAFGLLLALFCGMIYFHGAQDESINRVLIYTPDFSLEKVEAIKKGLPLNIANQIVICGSAEETSAFFAKESGRAPFLTLHLPFDQCHTARFADASKLLKEAAKNINPIWGYGYHEDPSIPEKLKPRKTDKKSSIPKERILANPFFQVADMVIEWGGDIWRHERIAVLLPDDNAETTAKRAMECLKFGYTRKEVQQTSGTVFLGLLLTFVIWVKSMKSAIFKTALRFSTEAARIATDPPAPPATDPPAPPATDPPAPPATDPPAPPATDPPAPPATDPPATPAKESRRKRQKRGKNKRP